MKQYKNNSLHSWGSIKLRKKCRFIYEIRTSIVVSMIKNSSIYCKGKTVLHMIEGGCLFNYTKQKQKKTQLYH